MKANLDIASRQEGRELDREELRVRPCDVDVKVLERIDSIHQTVKFGDELNFVKKDVGLQGWIDLCLDELPSCAPGREVGKQETLEIDGYDLLLGNAFCAQFILEELKKHRLATTADSRVFTATNTVDGTGVDLKHVFLVGQATAAESVVVSEASGRVIWDAKKDLPKGFKTRSMELYVDVEPMKGEAGK